MVWDKDKFLSIPSQLHSLDPAAITFWGLMTPKHMAEYNVGSCRISNGHTRAGVTSRGEELEKRRRFLFSDISYAQNITNLVFGDGLAPLRKPDLSAAIAQLENEMISFFEYHSNNPTAIEAHPVFGELDFKGSMQFQSKHMAHHLGQFELS